MSAQFNILLVHEETSHQSARDALIKACFSTPQPERAAYRLRAQVAPIAAYSTIALNAGKVIGSVRFSPVGLPDQTTVLMLGPLAIAPTLRGHHIGRKLVLHGLKQLQDNGEKGVIIIGDAGYFFPLGFDISVTQNLTPPGIVAPLSLMGIEWEERYLTQQTGALQPITST